MSEENSPEVIAKDRALSSHGKGDSLYNHAARQVKSSVLGLAVVLTLGFSAVELQHQANAPLLIRSMINRILLLLAVFFIVCD